MSDIHLVIKDTELSCDQATECTLSECGLNSFIKLYPSQSHNLMLSPADANFMLDSISFSVLPIENTNSPEIQKILQLQLYGKIMIILKDDNHSNTNISHKKH